MNEWIFWAVTFPKRVHFPHIWPDSIASSSIHESTLKLEWLHFPLSALIRNHSTISKFDSVSPIIDEANHVNLCCFCFWCMSCYINGMYNYYYYYNRFTTLCPGLPRWVGSTRIRQWHQLNDVQASCTLLQKITTPAPHQLDFYGTDALPDTQPTASKHWRHN